MVSLKVVSSYVVAELVISGIAIAQQPAFQNPTRPTGRIIHSAEDSNPRRLTINVSVTNPDDLKVTEGDLISVGQLIADRTRDRNRLEAQLRQLTLTLQRLEQSAITPPLPPQQPPEIATPTYLEETAAIDRAKANIDRAEALIIAKHRELNYLALLPNLDPLVRND